MEELSMKELQMKALQEQVNNLLITIKKSKRPRLDLRELSDKIKQYEIALDSSHIELRHLTNINDKVQWKTVLLEHKTFVKNLRQQYNTFETQLNKLELFSSEDVTTISVDNMDNNAEIIEHGEQVLKDSKDSLQRSIHTIHLTKDVGIDTIQKLEQNTIQIVKINDDIDIMESSFLRSTKTIKRLSRRMASDKIIWIFCVLIVGIVIAIIVLQVKKNTSNQDLSSSTSAPRHF